MHGGLFQLAEHPGVQADLVRAGDLDARGGDFQRRHGVVEDPEAGGGHAGPFCLQRDDVERDGRDRHQLEQPPQLPGLHLGGTEPGPQRLLLQYHAELLAAVEDDLLPLHAGRDRRVQVVGRIEEADPERQHRRAVRGRLEQARDHVVLINAEHAGPLVQRRRMRPGHPLHPRPGLAAELQVRGLRRPRRRDQVRYLVLGPAGPAPGPDVVVVRGLDAMLDLADAGEVLPGRRR